jgi:hypothetical protein
MHRSFVMKPVLISIILITLVLENARADDGPNQQAVSEYEAGKDGYENSPSADQGTPQWVDRTHALRKAIDHFLKSYELYPHSKSALFIAFLYGQLSQKNEAKNYAEIALNAHPTLTGNDAETANAIKEWAAPPNVNVKVTLYGGDFPPKSVKAPQGNIR